jgi:hypothetical protein
LRWLAAQKFDHPAQQIVFQGLVDAVRAATQRLAEFERHGLLRDKTRPSRIPKLAPSVVERSS